MIELEEDRKFNVTQKINTKKFVRVLYLEAKQMMATLKTDFRRTMRVEKKGRVDWTRSMPAFYATMRPMNPAEERNTFANHALIFWNSAIPRFHRIRWRKAAKKWNTPKNLYYDEKTLENTCYWRIQLAGAGFFLNERNKSIIKCNDLGIIQRKNL